jgi:hypothetical protein
MKPIPALEREWVEGLLAAMALAPDTRDDYTNQPVGMICGIARPEYGPAIYDLRCQVCEATWSGIPGDPCWWCEDALDRQRLYQIDLLLTIPDIDIADATYEARMRAWLQRMKVGVEAGLITRAQAEKTWWNANKKAAA